LAIRTPWEPNQRIEHGYFRSLQGITVHLREAIKSETDPFKIVRILKTILNTPAFHRYAQETALRMVTNLFVSNAKSWREAARQSSKSRIIYNALQRELQGPVGGAVSFQIQRNAELIKTLPLDIAERVTDYISEASFKGRRAADIAEDIQRMFPENSRAKAQLIARTEVSKTSTALTRARAENIGLDWYVWRTSEDQRVRSSHKHMDRVLVRWTDPPSPEELIGERSYGHYHSGDIFNCRCYPAPLTGIDRVSWPHKVYMNGTITMMTLSQFRQLAA
jgi:SPP1 gp7 family putative phage head morphogenesis protein